MKKMMLALSAAFLAANAHAGWDYDEKTERMTGKMTKTAVVRSDNSLSLTFPYAGPNHGYLSVRQHPQYGLDVIVSVAKGQILCSSHRGCPIQVKFDDSAPVKFEGSPPDDGGSTAAFLHNAGKFISLAKNSKKILVQFNMYKAGAPILEFSTPDPLKWPAKEDGKK